MVVCVVDIIHRLIVHAIPTIQSSLSGFVRVIVVVPFVLCQHLFPQLVFQNSNHHIQCTLLLESDNMFQIN